MEKTYNTSTSQKKSGMIILILDNVDIGVRNITRNKIPIYSNKGENLWEHIKIPHMWTNHRIPIYVKQNLTGITR